jgi:hypothetical protein
MDAVYIIKKLCFFVADPVPGGCNMEFDTELAPYLSVSYTTDLIVVKSQLAAPPLPYDCTSKLLDYDVYHLYLPERDFSSAAYFDGVRKMLSPERIEQYAKKVGPLLFFLFFCFD